MQRSLPLRLATKALAICHNDQYSAFQDIGSTRPGHYHDNHSHRTRHHG
jgi:hypothetical protein